MALEKSGFFDLENHFAFYGAYHTNPVNTAIHVLFVWPIFFSALLILHFSPSIFNLPNLEFSLWSNHVILVWNVGFLVALLYSLFYVALDLKAGSLAALLCALCWVGSSFVATQLRLSLAWKVNQVIRFYWYENGSSFSWSLDFLMCMEHVCFFIYLWLIIRRNIIIRY